MDRQKIDICEDSCMLFWKEHKDETKCLKCGKSRYVEIEKEDGTIEKVARKQMDYGPITPRIKQLFASGGSSKFVSGGNSGQN